VYTDADSPAVIGKNVTIGHNAVVHGCVIEERCLMGISAVVLSRAVVKKGSFVAAGSVVIENQRIDPNHLAAGVPAKIKNRIEEKSADDLPQSVKNYLEIARIHRGIYQHKKV
jgi:carbonic anhydrase/acetyltransferase-like protein (isoleucine patch superfamily)